MACGSVVPASCRPYAAAHCRQSDAHCTGRIARGVLHGASHHLTERRQNAVFSIAFNHHSPPENVVDDIRKCHHCHLHFLKIGMNFVYIMLFGVHMHAPDISVNSHKSTQLLLFSDTFFKLPFRNAMTVESLPTCTFTVRFL